MTELENKFVINGFLVDRTPPIDERFNLPWTHKYSIPYYDDGEIVGKPIVFYDVENECWAIRFQGIYKSEYPAGFATNKRAFDFAVKVLQGKSQ